MRGYHPQNPGKCSTSPPASPTVRVDILPQQRNFFYIEVFKLIDLTKNICRVARDFSSAHVGHDAIGTEIVTPVHNGDKRSECSWFVVVFPKHIRRRLLECISLLAFGDHVEYESKGLFLVGTKHIVHAGRPALNGTLVLFRHAPDHSEHKSPLFFLAES